MTVFYIPFTFSVAYFKRGGRIERQEVCYERVPVEIPEYGSSDVSHTGLVVQPGHREWGELDRVGSSRSPVSYYRTEKANWLVPWAGADRWEWAETRASPESLQATLDRETQNGLHAGCFQVTPGPGRGPRREGGGPLPHMMELNAREIVASDEDARRRSVQAYWSRACFVDGVLFVPTPGPVDLAYPRQTVLYPDAYRLSLPGTICCGAQDTERMRKMMLYMNDGPSAVKKHGHVLECPAEMPVVDTDWLTALGSAQSVVMTTGGRTISSLDRLTAEAYFAADEALNGAIGRWERPSNELLLELASNALILARALPSSHIVPTYLRGIEHFVDELEPLRQTLAQAEEQEEEPDFEVSAGGPR